MNFVVYKSSAGSGKTYTLVKEYLKIIIKNPEQKKYRNVLAITFTNKAADEMRQRVLGYLKMLSTKEDTHSNAYKSLLCDLKKETKLSEEEISENSGKVLKSILHDYYNFSIGTIDSFVYKIIRTFTHDLNIPVNSEIELDTEDLILQSIDLLLSYVNTDNNENLTKVLTDFVSEKIKQGKSWNIEKNLKDFTKYILEEDQHAQYLITKLKQFSINDFLKIKEQVNYEIKNIETKMYAHAKKACDLIKNNNLSANDFYMKTRGIAKYFENIKNKNFDKIKPNSNVKNTIDNDKWYANDTGQSKQIDNIKDDLKNYYEEITKHLDEYTLFKLINKNIYLIALLNEIEKAFNEIKSQNNKMLISEFNKKISNVILKSPVPFIYERVGEKYEHFLIDEFQDTSLIQWQNFLPLIENSLANNNFNMLVGDAKQAIYRWRGGDVDQFIKLPQVPNNDNKQIENSLIRNYEEKNLEYNYRSKKEIIDFNNNFFNEAANCLPEEYKNIYQNINQQIPDKNNTGGLVKIKFLDCKSAEELNNANYKETEDIITKLLKENFQLKDIAVLCRKNIEATGIAKYLIEHGIKVISSESLILGKSQTINFIYGVIKFLNDNDDNIAKIQIINFLINSKKIKSESLNQIILKIKKDNDYPVEIFIDYMKKQGFDINISQLVKLSIYELCEEIVHIFKLDVSSGIQFFLDAVYSFSLKNNTNITDFIQWWEEKKDKTSIIAPEKINAVRIMTIHKSKGLEFPVVIYAFAIQKFETGRNKYTWIDFNNIKLAKLKALLIPVNKGLLHTEFSDIYEKEEDKSHLDLINLLYVVMTRASERLYILTQKTKKINQPLKSVPEIFAKYTDNDSDSEKSEYEYGNAAIHKPLSLKQEENICNLNKFVFSNRREKIPLKISDTPNERWGNIVHTALSKINSAGDINNALEDMYLKDIINDIEKNNLNNEILTLLSNPEIKPFFTEDLIVRNESEILSSKGKAFRPDRIIISAHKTAVIDYKTGRPAQEHKEQINEYAEILSEMGYQNIEKYLIYIRENKVVKI